MVVRIADDRAAARASSGGPLFESAGRLGAICHKTLADGFACVIGVCQYQSGRDDQSRAVSDSSWPNWLRTEAAPSGAMAMRKPLRRWSDKSLEDHASLDSIGRIAAN